MNRALKIALGIVSSIGGYLDVGAIATMAQAGALFGFRHIWVVVLGTICAIALAEMSGRFAAVSKHTIRAAMREQLGASFFIFTLLVSTVVNVLTVAAEIGGTALALQLVTGVGSRWWGVPVALLAWLILWRGTFSILENGIAVLGLVTLVFIVGAVMAHPPWGHVALGLVPRAPDHDAARYWFIAVGILGAIISPYMFYFYSSGAVEDQWDASYVGTNRAVAAVGMGFGALVGIGVLVTSATTFLPRGIAVDQYDQAALALVPTLGKAGFFLFAASLGVTCLGATMEATLSTAYEFAQGLGWNWGESVKPHEAARFSLAYTIVVAVGCAPTVLGLDPLRLTIFSMALNAVALPMLVLPFLVLMNQKAYLGEYTNGRFGNVVVAGIVLITFVLAIVSIPLELLGG